MNNMAGNGCVVIGRVVDDAVLKITKTGKPFVSFSVSWGDNLKKMDIYSKDYRIIRRMEFGKLKKGLVIKTGGNFYKLRSKTFQVPKMWVTWLKVLDTEAKLGVVSLN